MEDNLAIACSLTDAQLQQRRKAELSEVKAAMIAVKETENGFVYQFESSGERIAALTNLVNLEHECCPFLTFRITVEPGDRPVSLEISGPPGTKEFLAALFE